MDSRRDARVTAPRVPDWPSCPLVGRPTVPSQLGHFLLVDVVPNHAAENAAHRRADDATLDLVVARRRAEDRASRRADGGVTLRVLDDMPGARCGRRGAAARIHGPAAARAGARTGARMMHTAGARVVRRATRRAGRAALARRRSG